MNTNRQLIEQFLQFINTGDAAVGKPIISDDVCRQALFESLLSFFYSRFWLQNYTKIGKNIQFYCEHVLFWHFSPEN